MDSPISREKLYELVWTHPLGKIAPELGVSDSYLIRVCRALQVPRPGRGYWAKLAHGKKVIKPPLGHVPPGSQVEWSREGPLSEVIPDTEGPRGRGRKRHGLHGLLANVGPKFLRAREPRWSSDSIYLRPYKYILPDIIVTKESLEKSLDLANRLYMRMEAEGYSVGIASAHEHLHGISLDEKGLPTSRSHDRYGSPWRPRSPTVARGQAVCVGLVITEVLGRAKFRRIGKQMIPEAELSAEALRRSQYSHSEERSIPTGSFRVVAYAPYHDVEWLHRWESGDTTRLANEAVAGILARINDLIAEVSAASKRAEERKRQWDLQWRRSRLRENRENIIRSIDESKTALREALEAWGKAKRVAELLDAAEAYVSELSADERGALAERLALARKLMGPQDPAAMLRVWRTPEEIYAPGSCLKPGDEPVESDDEVGESEANWN